MSDNNNVLTDSVRVAKAREYMRKNYPDVRCSYTVLPKVIEVANLDTDSVIGWIEVYEDLTVIFNSF